MESRASLSFSTTSTSGMTEVDPEVSGVAGAGFVDTDLFTAAGAVLCARAWNEDQAKSANVRNLSFIVVVGLGMVLRFREGASTHQSEEQSGWRGGEFELLRTVYQENI